jgi:hypothetical protein
MGGGIEGGIVRFVLRSTSNRNPRSYESPLTPALSPPKRGEGVHPLAFQYRRPDSRPSPPERGRG